MDKEMEEQAVIVAFVMDLMFGSRIRGAAPASVLVRSAAEVTEAVGPGTRLVLIDLQAIGAQDALEALKDRGEGVKVVAWAPHVMEGALAAAREAGADEVLPRGAFVKQLPQLVAAATES